jgi:hypothetical protein
VLGNSTAAGVGVDNDRATLASRLNDIAPELLWANLAVGGHNLLQNAITFGMQAPESLDAVVIVAGLIDFLVPLMRQYDGEVLPPYLFPNDSAVRETSYDLQSNGWVLATLEAWCRRALEIIADQAARRNAKAVFVLQPHLALTAKKYSPQERCLVAVYGRSADRPIWKAHLHLARYRELISETLSRICRQIGLPFVDANTDSRLLTAHWLYLDYIHVNNHGHQRLAEISATALGLNV